MMMFQFLNLRRCLHFTKRKISQSRQVCSLFLTTDTKVSSRSRYLSQCKQKSLLSDLHLYERSRHSKESCNGISYKSLQCFGTHFIFRTFTRSPQLSSRADPKQQSRQQMLMLLTYLSGFIGVCLLSAIGFRQYAAFARRAQGIEALHVREYGRKPQLFRYRGFVFPDYIINDVKSIHQFDVREDDIWVVSFPKAGTTWVQEIVYLVSHDADFEKAAEANIEERFPFFEWFFPGKNVIDKMPSPRLIKSHLPLSMLPNQMSQKRPKIIYIARNPKDSAVSFYFFSTKFLNKVDPFFRGTFEDFCRLFVEDLVYYGPWWKHVREAWDRRKDDNILVLFYEDLQMDLRQAVTEIALFLNKPLTSAQIDAIVQHCTFDSMKNNQTTNYEWMKERGMAQEGQSFLRKGKIGDWKNHLSEDIIKKMDEIVASRLAPAGVPVRDS